MSGTNHTYARLLLDKLEHDKYRYQKYQSYTDIEKKTKRFFFVEKNNECAGFMKSAHCYKIITIFIPRTHTPYNEEFVKKWIDFVNNLGFPCQYGGKSNVDFFGKTYSINIYPRDYPSKGNHLLACHTLLRYLYSYRYSKIPEYTFWLMEKFELPDIKALYVAHYAESKNQGYRGYYGLLPKKYIKQQKYIYPPDVIKIYTELGNKSINKSFSNEIEKVIRHESLTKSNAKSFLESINYV